MHEAKTFHPFSVDPIPYDGTEAPAPEHIRSWHCSTAYFDALWTEAKMVEVIKYLKGGSTLVLPEEWKGAFSGAFIH